ncbi:MAG: hypothetical protein ACD_3C00128G0004 [uncultured bacterium (gcode 4)]|uniref:Uncharacterized protein n=1 Tax=uncultured bacterium (gcode 4) TaxID=1234023 RepID=K2FY82_9BACT|nr:MAG: hypothetical protein ACD_3C00128G0004 [uncultured bacterium (gcode 4)]
MSPDANMKIPDSSGKNTIDDSPRKNLKNEMVDILVKLYRKIVNSICKPKKDLGPEKAYIDKLIVELEKNLIVLRRELIYGNHWKDVKETMLESLEIWLITRWKLKSNLAIVEYEMNEKEISKVIECARQDYKEVLKPNSGDDSRTDAQLKIEADYFCWSLIWLIFNAKNPDETRIAAMKKLENIRGNEFYYLELLKFKALVKGMKGN